MLLQTAAAAASSAAVLTSPFRCRYCYSSKNLSHNSPFSSSILPLLDIRFHPGTKSRPTSLCRNANTRRITPPRATLLEAPVLWAGRLCIFYALLKAGLAGSPSNPLVSDLESGADDLGFSKWFDELSKPENDYAKAEKLERVLRSGPSV
ncbi:UNVERIFIED_CONTAM: hypothetical protein Sradi_0321800 [Sesamum radiatum]|uniref:Uncharacterized protein n=1 Tax=Sesamum radiatum TaxID=300843 RepID=A0AAW2W4I3_SESRA